MITITTRVRLGGPAKTDGWLALAPTWVVACTDALTGGSLSGHAGRGRGDRPGRAGRCGGPMAPGRAGPAGNGWPGRLDAVCLGHPDQGGPVGYGYCGMASELQICRLARVSCGP